MLYIIIILLLVGLLIWLLVHLFKAAHLEGVNKFSFIVVSCISIFGFLVGGVILSAIMNKNDINPRLGHYVISQFSGDETNIGRITLFENPEGFEVFPGNKEEKIVEVYKDGKLMTGELVDGQVILLPEEQVTKLTLPWVFLGK